MRIEIKSFSALSLEELYALLRVRSEIFVVEQQCIYLDLDGKDNAALHVLGWKGSELCGYCRVFRPGDYFEEASIGRVAVPTEFRGHGYGARLMEFTIQAIHREIGSCPIAISAQAYLQRFYEALGFKAEGELYKEDGIPHLRMVYTPE
ncbi:GNAT family N-acetyltransferase [Robiginitalea sp.]|jgi:ElaA protein|uniref:GNAT family N-acetyltransferase n=1 Tax=Robiginitalea sp. TaxID=1902411 RepID=UPI003C771AE6